MKEKLNVVVHGPVNSIHKKNVEQILQYLKQWKQN